MTVRELIDKLWTLPLNAEVRTPDDNDVFVTVDDDDDAVVYITDINPEDN